MKKKSLCLIALLLSCVAVTLIQSIEADSDASDCGSSVLCLTTPLASSEIAAAWPNLPTAQQLFNSDYAVLVNTSALGNLSSTNSPPNPHPNDPKVDLTISDIANYTSPDIISSYGIVNNVPHIWLQYNSTVWVQVPTTDLNTTVQPYASAIQQLETIVSPFGSPSPPR